MFSPDILKALSRRLVIRQMVRMLPTLSMGNIIRIIELGEKLINREDYKQISGSMKEYVKQGHPAVKLIERVLYDLSPECRFRTIYNLFILALLSETSRREQISVSEGFRPPLFFVVSPTMRCNLNCFGCYAGEYDQGDGLRHEEVDRIFGEALDMGIHFITLSGGEPFLRPDLLDLFEKHRDIIFQVYTNGTLLDEKTVGRLARLGNVAPMISLEGLGEITDRRRGQGHFTRTMDLFDLLRDAGLLFGVSVSQTRHNYLEVSSHDFARLLVEKGAYVVWYFQYIPIGREPDTGLMLLPNQRDTVRRRLREIRNSYPLFICDFWNDGPYIAGCLAGGREYFHINANGDVEPCVFVHFAVDNIEGKSLKEVLNSPFFKGIRANQPFSDNPLTPCMIIDAPDRLRALLHTYNAHPTHEGAETMVNQLAGFLDEYSGAYRRIADRTWQEEYRDYHPGK